MWYWEVLRRAHELKCRWRAAGGVEAIDRKEERWQGVDDGQGDRVGVDRVDDGQGCSP